MKGFKLHTVGLLAVFAGPRLSFHSTIESTKEKHESVLTESVDPEEWMTNE